MLAQFCRVSENGRGKFRDSYIESLSPRVLVQQGSSANRKVRKMNSLNSNCAHWNQSNRISQCWSHQFVIKSIIEQPINYNNYPTNNGLCTHTHQFFISTGPLILVGNSMESIEWISCFQLQNWKLTESKVSLKWSCFPRTSEKPKRVLYPATPFVHTVY